MARALARARELASKGPSTERLIALGQGWVAEEALAMAVYAALAAPSLEEALVLAVNHSGDSDSVGAIAGNILGTAQGIRSIPQRWLHGLELREVIERLGADAAKVRPGGPEAAEALARTYPGW